MRKIYLIAALLLASISSYGQTANLRLIHLVIPDTIKWKNPNVDAPTTIKWGFINMGPDSLMVTDTLVLKNLNVNNAPTSLYMSSSLQVGDTVTYQHSFFFSSVTGGSPISFCDSLWAKHAGNAIIPDPDVTNNKVCKAMVVKQVVTGVAEVAGSKNFTTLNIFPNPASTAINFKYNLAGGDAIVMVRDMIGHVVYQEKIEKSFGERTMRIDINNFQNGTYLVEVNGSQVKSIGRIVIQK